MIGECLDVLPDVLYYHRPAVNDLSIKDCVTSPMWIIIIFFIFCATERLIQFW